MPCHERRTRKTQSAQRETLRKPKLQSAKSRGRWPTSKSPPQARRPPAVAKPGIGSDVLPVPERYVHWLRASSSTRKSARRATDALRLSVHDRCCKTPAKNVLTMASTPIVG